MASISKRTAERLASGIKRFQPILAAIQKNRILKREALPQECYRCPDCAGPFPLTPPADFLIHRS